MKNKDIPAWDRLIAAAAHLQKIVPDAVLVGGTATAMHASHRLSMDADHVIPNLREQFDEILVDLNAVAGWKTARTAKPVLILGSLDGIETGIRQLRRTAPLETEQLKQGNHIVRVPTRAEMLRIKGLLILQRNATRDYLDFAALADSLTLSDVQLALSSFDCLYEEIQGNSPLQQLLIQLADPRPFDLSQIDLSEYKQLHPAWHDWKAVQRVCQRAGSNVMNAADAKKEPCQLTQAESRGLSAPKG